MSRRNSGPQLRFFEKRGYYYIFWTEGGRSRERSTGTRDRREAERAFGEFLLNRIDRTGPRNPDQILLTDLFAEYATTREATRSFTRIAFAVAALVPFWTGRTVADVTETRCRQYAKERGVANNTLRVELSVLRAAINLAVDANRLTRPVPVWIPKSPEPRDVWLTRSEAARLLRAARKIHRAPYLSLAILLGIYTGRRMEAILSLRWHKVDLINETIDYRRPAEAETNKKRGIVKIHRKLLGHLRRAKRNAGEMAFVVGGRRLKQIKQSFARAVAASGIEKKITMHTLKHSCATWLMQQGVTIFDAADFLATSVRTLEKVYAHHAPDHQERALKAFG
jgi:integrase